MLQLAWAKAVYCAAQTACLLSTSKGWICKGPGLHAGPSEGVFGWVAANYASGALQGYALRQGLRLRKPAKPSAPFVGVFELGGASAQVTLCDACVTDAQQVHHGIMWSRHISDDTHNGDYTFQTSICVQSNPIIGSCV